MSDVFYMDVSENLQKETTARPKCFGSQMQVAAASSPNSRSNNTPKANKLTKVLDLNI